MANANINMSTNYEPESIAYFNACDFGQFPYKQLMKDTFNQIVLLIKGKNTSLTWVIGTDKPAGTTIQDTILETCQLQDLLVIDNNNYQWRLDGITLDQNPNSNTYGTLNFASVAPNGLQNGQRVTIWYNTVKNS